MAEDKIPCQAILTFFTTTANLLISSILGLTLVRSQNGNGQQIFNMDLIRN
jgi:hypothetical protein